MFARVIRAVDKFWFEGKSPSPLCVFRIIYGLLLIANTFLLLPDLFTWFGPHALLSPQTVHAYEHQEQRFSLFFIFGDSSSLVIALYTALLIAAVMLTIGFRTRLSALIVFVCLLSFHERMPCIFNAADTILRQQAFLMMFSHAGDRYSVDSKMAGTKNNPVASPWAWRLMQIQLACVYFQVFDTKIVRPEWIDGSAVYYCGRLVDFAKFPMPLFESYWACRILSWMTLAIEFSLFTLIWFKPLRMYVIVLGILMHLGIDWAMTIPIFEYVMIAGFVLFLEPDELQYLQHKLFSLQRNLSQLIPGRNKHDLRA